MKGVLGKLAFRQLPVVVAIDEQTQVFDQGMEPSGKATRFSGEAFEVMAQVGIHRFHGVSLLLVWA